MTLHMTPPRYQTTHLQILHDLAHDSAEVPRLGDVADDRGRQTDDDDEDVGEREVDDEVVRHGAHVSVAPDGEADERVADEPKEEDDSVQRDEDPLERRREDVSLNHVHVVVVADAVLVPAFDRRCRWCRRRVRPDRGQSRCNGRDVHG